VAFQRTQQLVGASIMFSDLRDGWKDELVPTVHLRQEEEKDDRRCFDTPCASKQAMANASFDVEVAIQDQPRPRGYNDIAVAMALYTALQSTDSI